MHRDHQNSQEKARGPPESANRKCVSASRGEKHHEDSLRKTAPRMTEHLGKWEVQLIFDVEKKVPLVSM